jgi:gliding-associated putative ABC transporter substrate-binding component GldG
MQNKNFNLIIFIAIIVFINLVSLSVFTRLDFSKGNIYSLADASKKAVDNLEDRLVVKAYFSENLPGEYADAKRYTKDILAEYQAYSHGKFSYEFLDPANEQELKQEARKNQIFPVSMRVVENDKLEIREVYMGLAFMYQGKTESIPVIENTRGLEYDVTSKIKKITSQGLKKLAFFQTDNLDTPTMPQMQQRNPNDKLSTVRQLLSESYELQKTDLSEKIDSDTDVLVFTGVKDSLTTQQLYNFDQFVMSGGNVVVFQDRVEVNMQQQQASMVRSNIFGLLQHYGISIKNNLVTDAQCGQIQVQRQQGIFRMATPVEYPLFPMITNVNEDNLIVKNLDQMQMIYASEIDTTRVGSGLQVTPLLFTSDNSGEIKGPRYNININQYMQADLKQMFQEAPKVVAAIYNGSLHSYFADNAEYPEAKKSVESASIIVLPDSQFMTDDAGAGAQPNLDFVQNSVDYLASESTLIEIRSRGSEFRPLQEISASARKAVKWINILLPSLLLIIFGILHYRAELKRRKYIGELYE